ncbi:hypothetical protein Anapl_15738 [Anas platyrhynchos]|uniref:Uncharacterized protein n=1 Tax=Anas platyrhynchos TaxID=8839 RepID=R0KUJ5_ANAPL|nr:hypothetical protein Anapl_15738 [Anas platyrhynchos]
MATGQHKSPDGAQELSGEALADVGWSCANSFTVRTGCRQTVRHCSLSQQHTSPAGEGNRSTRSGSGSSQAAAVEPFGNEKANRVSATLCRLQTVFYPFDSQSQSAAEPLCFVPLIPNPNLLQKLKKTTGRKGLTTGACSLLLPCSGSRNQAGQLEAVPPAPASGSAAMAGPWAPPLYL